MTNLYSTLVKKLIFSFLYILAALPFLLSGKSWAESEPVADKRILFILSGDSHGYWLSEVIEPYQLLQQAGFEIDIASPLGGKGYAAGRSRLTSSQKTWLRKSTLNTQLNNIKALNKIQAENYQAIYFPGGSGPMFDLVDNLDVQNITRTIYEAGGYVSADCHGPAALVNVKLSDGKHLVEGKKLTAKANIEEGYWAKNNYPFLLEDKFKSLGALYSRGDKNSVHVVVDNRLITGQNPASAILMTEKLIEALTGP